MTLNCNPTPVQLVVSIHNLVFDLSMMTLFCFSYCYIQVSIKSFFKSLIVAVYFNEIGGKSGTNAVEAERQHTVYMSVAGVPCAAGTEGVYPAGCETCEIFPGKYELIISVSSVVTECKFSLQNKIKTTMRSHRSEAMTPNLLTFASASVSLGVFDYAQANPCGPGVSTEEKHPHSVMLPPPCFIVEFVCSG